MIYKVGAGNKSKRLTGIHPPPFPHPLRRVCQILNCFFVMESVPPPHHHTLETEYTTGFKLRKCITAARWYVLWLCNRDGAFCAFATTIACCVVVIAQWHVAWLCKHDGHCVVVLPRWRAVLARWCIVWLC